MRGPVRLDRFLVGQLHPSVPYKRRSQVRLRGIRQLNRQIVESRRHQNGTRVAPEPTTGLERLEEVDSLALSGSASHKSGLMSLHSSVSRTLDIV